MRAYKVFIIKGLYSGMAFAYMGRKYALLLLLEYKKMVRKVLFAGAAALSLFAAMPAFATDLIVNGGFENTGAGFGGTTGYFNIGNMGSNADNAVPASFGWSVPINNVDIVANGVYGPTLPTGGAYSLDLVGYGTTGAISQTLATTVGQTYAVTLGYSSNNGVTAPTADISANGLVLDTITGSTDWQTYTKDFTATSSTTVFEISEVYGANNGGVFLDNISVNAVPEPATWAMMLLGFGMVGFAMRSRRKQNVNATYA